MELNNNVRFSRYKLKMHETPNPRSLPARRHQLICNHRDYKQFQSKICSYAFICFHNGLPAGKKPKLALNSQKSPLFLCVLPLLSVASPKCVWNLPKFHFIF